MNDKFTNKRGFINELLLKSLKIFNLMAFFWILSGKNENTSQDIPFFVLINACIIIFPLTYY